MKNMSLRICREQDVIHLNKEEGAEVPIQKYEF